MAKVAAQWIPKLLNFESKFTVRLTLDTISESEWKLLELPSYSPDLSHVWPLKEAFEGQRFSIDDEVEEFVHAWLSELLKEFFDTDINNFQKGEQNA